MSYYSYEVLKPDSVTPILEAPGYRDTKDPCTVFDGTKWHLYGSGGSSLTEEWEILHATAPSVAGPWEVQDAATLHGVDGIHVAAPGVVRDDEGFHMFVQTEFMSANGTLEYLRSGDGTNFDRVNTALFPIPESNEAGIYDVHPAEIGGRKYLTYAGFSGKKDCNLYLAESVTNRWEGPWDRAGVLINYRDIPEHNQPDDPDYEWGLEGPQLVELPDKSVLLVAVCFLRGHQAGKRQRVFFSRAPSVQGPYEIMGPVITPTLDGWLNGENGHAAAILVEDYLHLFFQARSFKPDTMWRYGVAPISLLGAQAMQSELIAS